MNRIQINKDNLHYYLELYRQYVESQDGGSPFISYESNHFLYREEGYKTDIFHKSKSLLSSSSITENDIGSGKIADIVLKVISCGENLVYSHQKTHCKNKIGENLFEAEKILYSIFWKSNDHQSFEQAVDFFGAKYDLIAYLFFIKDYSRYLPISPGNFDKSFSLLGIDFTTSNHCSWINYQKYNGLISDIADAMQSYYGFTIRLIDAHSFIWQLKSIKDKTPTIDWNLEIAVTKDIEGRTVRRIGQNRYRKDLIELWGGCCSVTDCRKTELLVASHIKPWSHCSENNEWLNPYNGLLLIPTLDLAFDQGFITFEDDGNIRISSLLDIDDCQKLSISSKMKLRRIHKETLPFLYYHRENIFKK